MYKIAHFSHLNIGIILEKIPKKYMGNAIKFVNKSSAQSLVVLIFSFMNIAYAADKPAPDNVSDDPHISSC